MTEEMGRIRKTNFDWNTFMKGVAVIAIPVALHSLLTTTGSMIDTMMIASLGEKTVAARNIALSFTSDTDKGQQFLTTCRAIQEMLTATEAWNDLPEYEHLYE